MPGYAAPAGGFFLWLPLVTARPPPVGLWRETGVRVLPGAYLGRAPRPPRTRAPTTSASPWSPTRPRSNAAHRDPHGARGGASAPKGSTRWPRARKAKPRAPLMESDTEVALRRRGAELIGLILVGARRARRGDDLDLSRPTIRACSAPPTPRRATRSGWSARRSPTRCTARSAGPPTASPLALAVWGGAPGAARGPIPAPSAVPDRRCRRHPRRRDLRRHARAAVGLGATTASAGLLGDAALGAASLSPLAPFDLALALARWYRSLPAFVALASGYALGVTWAETRGFLRLPPPRIGAALFRPSTA